MVVAIPISRAERCQLLLLLVWINYPVAVIGSIVIWSLSQNFGNGVVWFLAWQVISIFAALGVK
ncbi:hypothetical protein PITC_094700 [Penicillium italicum]|uniref:Uncharacterized protein n=1 Tax=Penicillium italicum TaxID=40296 RepID=A0A0A2KQT9_PENIT|nr:hypothetical protein PITC_094700 [Penicillium italicum]